MTRVTQHYDIAGSVPFVDVHVEQDSELFLEPSAIRAAATAGDQYAARADRQLASFAGELLDSTYTGDWPRGRNLLEPLHEPNETRLGMTAVGAAGHGFALGKAQELWRSIQRNRACQDQLIVNRLEDLTLFVDGVGPDLVSDLATRVTFDVLADYTSAMCARYPQLADGETTRIESIWDATAGRWTTQLITLPVAAGKRLLLVPTNWVWTRQLLNARSFYQIKALGRIQEQQTVPAQLGQRPIVPTKKSLEADHPAVRPTNITQAVEAVNEGIRLVLLHTTYVQHRFAEIKLNADDINRLIN